MAEVGGVADGFGDEVLGSANGFDGGIAEEEEREERGGEGAAGSVGGGGFEVLADEPVDFSGGETEDVGGLGVIAGGGDDVEVGVAASESVGGGFGVGEILDGESGEGGELGPVGRDPGDCWKKLLVEGFECLGREEAGAGAGAEDGVEDDRRFRLIPCLLVEGGEKSCDCRGDFAGPEHANLDAGGREVGAEVVEGAAEERWGDGLDLGDAQGGLDGEGGNGRGSEETMGGEGLEIGGDSRSAGGIVASDGEKGSGIWGGRRREGGQGRQPRDLKTLSYLAVVCKQK